MQGTLDTFGIVEILQMLGNSKRSGTLHIECPQRLIDVHFVNGRIAETRDSTRVTADAVLGSQLLKRSLINESQLSEVLAEQERSPRPIGTLLVEHGYLREEDLRDVLSRQVANTLVAAKAEGNGTFMLVIESEPRALDYLTIETYGVLVEISSVGSEYCLAFEVLGQADTVVLRNRDYGSLPRNTIAMGRDEFHVLSLVDDQSTVAEIAAASRIEEITVVSILGKLAEAGVLLVKSEQKSDEEADDELRAHRNSVWEEVSQLFDDISVDTGETAAAAGRPSLDASSSDALDAFSWGDMINE